MLGRTPEVSAVIAHGLYYFVLQFMNLLEFILWIKAGDPNSSCISTFSSKVAGWFGIAEQCFGISKTFVIYAVWRGSNSWLVKVSMALMGPVLPPGLQGSQLPCCPCTDRQTELCTNGATAHAKGPLPHSSMGISASAAPERAQLCQCRREDALASVLCHSRPGGSCSVGKWTQDAGRRVPRLIPWLVLVHGLAALLELVHLPHPSGFSHLLLFAFLIFFPIFSPMPNFSPSS